MIIIIGPFIKNTRHKYNNKLQFRGSSQYIKDIAKKNLYWQMVAYHTRTFNLNTNKPYSVRINPRLYVKEQFKLYFQINNVHTQFNIPIFNNKFMIHSFHDIDDDYYIEKGQDDHMMV